MRSTTIELHSTLAADDAVVWAHSTSLEGISSELPGPLRLSSRPAVTSLEAFLAAGSVLAVLRIGPVPLMRWHPAVAELGARHFVERSTDMTAMRSWRHERRVDPAEGGCSVVDRVTISPRLPGSAAAVRWFFGRRHRALRRRFGG